MRQRFNYTDAELDDLRTRRKVKTSGTRPKNKGQFVEQQYTLEAVGDPGLKFRLYSKHLPRLDGGFSVGLSLLLPERDLTLCRYNGGSHAHKNEIEGDSFGFVCHIHYARAEYLRRGKHDDGYALPTHRFSTVENALLCILQDCNIHGIVDLGDSDPNTLDLFER